MSENRLDLRKIFVMTHDDYQDIVEVACFAVQRGFSVRYAGEGKLIVDLNPEQNGEEV